MFGAMLTAWMLSACATVEQTESSQDTKRMKDTSPSLTPGYMLDVRVMVAGEDEIVEEGIRIQESGHVTLPLIGSVQAAGRSLQEFQSWLTQEYNQSYFIDPIVSVGISVGDNDSTFPWGYVTVLGRVETPGQIRIPPTRDLTITQAIREAGGFIKYAKESRIEITRQEKDGTTKRIMFDMREMARSSGEANLRLQPGDVIYVPEVIF